MSRFFGILKVFLAMAILLAPLTPNAWAGSAAEIDAEVNDGLKRLFASEPEAKNLAAKAVAVLVFPNVIKAGLIVGGEYGEGALRRGGKTTGYYSVAAASYGLLAGGQRFGYAMFFLTEDALKYLDDSEGFEVGVGPTLVGGDEGWTASHGTSDLQGDIAVVFFGQEGLMAGGGIKGSKISRIDR